MLRKTTFRSLTHIEQQTWKTPTQIHLPTYVKYGFRCADFHEIRSTSINCCGRLSYKILIQIQGRGADPEAIHNLCLILKIVIKIM
jgi:hypothetical protein